MSVNNLSSCLLATSQGCLLLWLAVGWLKKKSNSVSCASLIIELPPPPLSKSLPSLSLRWVGPSGVTHKGIWKRQEGIWCRCRSSQNHSSLNDREICVETCKVCRFHFLHPADVLGRCGIRPRLIITSTHLALIILWI